MMVPKHNKMMATQISVKREAVKNFLSKARKFFTVSQVLTSSASSCLKKKKKKKIV